MDSWWKEILLVAAVCAAIYSVEPLRTCAKQLTRIAEALEELASRD
jgi:hypothetical protein